MKKLTISIAAKRYDISVSEEFATIFEKELEETFIKGNNDIKTLLSAYVKKSYEKFLLECEIDKMNEKLKIKNLDEI